MPDQARLLAADPKAQAAHRRINATTVPYPGNRSVAQLFEAVADRCPSSAAVVCGNRTLTYRQLNELANVLTARLGASGVQPGDAVGVSSTRSPEMIASLIAVLKCGAAYLPFDPDWPETRLHDLFEQAACRLLLAAQAPAGRWPVVSSAAADDVGGVPNPLPAAAPDAIAYINFTSGSTGRPKGVPIRHQSIARLVFGARYARLDQNTVTLQLAPVTFDAATFEIWAPLLNGGTCVLYPSAFVRFSELRRVLLGHRVTTLFLTTALFNAIVDEAPGTLDSVKTVLTGGEAHSLKHIAKALRCYGPDRLTSVYGPTECTTFATYYPVRKLLPGEMALPIGVPIQNTRTYVVSGERLCAPGESGEILLAGPGLSPGYLGLPEVTRERFVEREIDGVPERLYRTGDRAFMRDDGTLVFQGRSDDQVKVSGFRIELGEVSHHLDLCSDVRQSFVTVDDGAGGEKSLVAFVVPETAECTVQGIKDQLRARLPSYMIPARISFCGSLPLSATGKVNRRVLMSIHHARSESNEHQ